MHGDPVFLSESFELVVEDIHDDESVRAAVEAFVDHYNTLCSNELALIAGDASPSTCHQSSQVSSYIFIYIYIYIYIYIDIYIYIYIIINSRLACEDVYFKGKYYFIRFYNHQPQWYCAVARKEAEVSIVVPFYF